MRRILSLRLTPSGIRRPSTRFALLLRRSGAVTLSLILSIASLFAVIGAVANAPLPAQAQPPGDSVPVSAENRATQTPSPTATPGALERGDELSPGDSMPEMLESLSGISVGEHVITTTVAFSVAAGSDDAGVDAAGGGCDVTKGFPLGSFTSDGATTASNLSRPAFVFRV